MYDLYKRLRNYLRSFSLLSGLRLVDSIFKEIHFDQPLVGVTAAKPNLSAQSRLGVFSWELDILAREMLINCPVEGGRPFSSFHQLREAWVRVRNIENELWGRHEDGGHDILYELIRIAHRQFPWQRGVSAAAIGRALWMFSDPAMESLVRSKHEMGVKELFQVVFATVGHFLSAQVLALPVGNSLNRVPAEKVNDFISRCSLSISKHRDLALDVQSYDVNWAYTLSPFRHSPLLEIGAGRIVCPILPFLAQRAIEGLYYDLVGRDNFSSAFGGAFQRMFGEVVRRIGSGGRMTAIPEERYGSRSKPRDSVDWIVEDGTATLFVECKASRMKLRGKINLATRSEMEDELSRLGDFAAQLYMTLADALDGRYRHWSPEDRPIYPVIVTLDDWQAFGPAVIEAVNRKVKDLLVEKGVDVSLLERLPYSIVSLRDLEYGLQVMATRGIERVMNQKISEPYFQWSLDAFLRSCFADDLRTAKPLFRDEYSRLFDRG